MLGLVKATLKVPFHVVWERDKKSFSIAKNYSNWFQFTCCKPLLPNITSNNPSVGLFQGSPRCLLLFPIELNHQREQPL